MALTVEDGTGLANANSYVSLVDANAYWQGRLDDGTWGGSPDWKKERALIQATEFLDWRYGSDFGGSRLKSAQRLLFPRYGLYDAGNNAVSGVPRGIKAAVALKAGALLEEEAGVESVKEIKSEEVGAGGAMVKTEYATPFRSAPTGAIRNAEREIKDLIAPYLQRHRVALNF